MSTMWGEYEILFETCIVIGTHPHVIQPVEWIDKHYSDGKTKREITKRIPVLECKRNHEHCYVVDPAEDKVK